MLKSYHVDTDSDGTQRYFINDTEVTQSQYQTLLALLDDGTFGLAVFYHLIAKQQEAYERAKAQLGDIFLELMENDGKLQLAEFGTPEYDAAWRGQSVRRELAKP